MDIYIYIYIYAHVCKKSLHIVFLQQQWYYLMNLAWFSPQYVTAQKPVSRQETVTKSL